MGVPSLPGKKRRQMPGVCPGGMLKLRFGWYISECEPARRLSVGKRNARNFTDTSDLLNKHQIKSLFLFFILFGGWSLEGSVRVVRGPVRR